jgi:hypothetical protein
MPARESTWRPIARGIIRRVILRNRYLTCRGNDKELRAVFRKAYPFIGRFGWKYTVWLQEIERQLGELRKFQRWQIERGGFEFDDMVLAWLKGEEWK